ncbi:hypothetical protein HPB52_006016 [Rhipicephalus sanguineus]|uniref:Ionotropic glutamate receptor C-terminal domain-containing protein n=1 Tax=Rhipicephalus sanguineus TaxID=34632 RepID=A0A9D4PVU8_RHISA|nr:hypothetical protein HPB52_006016 [Rhipicephalus sanguineus]
MNLKHGLQYAVISLLVTSSSESFEGDNLFNNLNITINKDNRLNVISNCGKVPVQAFKRLNIPFSTWGSSGMGRFLTMANMQRGYNSDVLVACWEPTFGHLHSLVRSLRVPFLHLRWIYLMENLNVTSVSQKSMSNIFRRVGCRAVIVTKSAAYVPLDTYVNCSSGVRSLEGPHDDPFRDRSLANLTTLANIWEHNLRTRKDWRKSRLEPQTTIVESIVRKSGASIAKSVDFGRFGRSNEHGVFTGAVGAIQAKRRDLGSFEVYLSEDLWYAVDVAGQVRYDALTFLAPLPKVITDLAIIGRPFTLPLWMAVWTSLSIYLLLLVAVMTTHGANSKRPRRASEEAVNYYFYLCSALVNRAPAVRMPERSSARILIGFWFLFAIVISSGYNAMLTSYTNFPPKTRPIRNLEQLSRAVERNTIELCIVRNRYLREVVSYHLSLRSRVLREHLDEVLRAAVCPDTLCCLRKVAAGTHVFFTNREEARLNTGKTFRGAVRADEDFVLVHVVMLAPRSSPYTEAFARVTQRLTETGVSAFSQKLRKFWHIRNTATWKEQVHRGKGSSFRVLRLTDLCGMVVVWGFGLTLALCVFFCEVAWEALWKSRVQRTNTHVARARRKLKERSPPTQSQGEGARGSQSPPLLFFGFPKDATSETPCLSAGYTSTKTLYSIGRGPRRVYVAVGKKWFL